ncbi:hypothetical protein Ssi03_77200 [Sphaerisporangium siamense]|uniref:Helicase ATP-binding domain-containing protein n=1 Tax=Sphaerisporangium siamense TaxID=795645 RepID=A0A7W7GCU7_9ACTN|nr:hypothetical protein [Sphaerisporangium siamense]MBB4702341.1 hypothetical protein [Sphaerisporangium siamense]GII89730.1 hypothetical protein Ssi03_77200 [Sphaerisporangium siamense]
MSELPVRHVFVYAALALAGHYFPRHENGGLLAPFREAAFFAARKPQAWDGWHRLDHEARRRVADVMALAPAELADAKAFAVAARSLLGALDDDVEQHRAAVLRPFILAGDIPSRADAARPHVGGDLLAYVDRITARFRRPSARQQPADFAGPGVWHTQKVYVTGEGWVHGKLTIPTYPDFVAAPDHSTLPTVSTVPYTPEISPTVKELLDAAALVERRYDSDTERYLHDTLARLFSKLHCEESSSVVEVMRLIAGRTQILNAPTGTGKTVLVRVLASWFALQGLRIALVVPDVKATLSTAWDISADLEFLHQDGHLEQRATCVPLMSPNRRQERALKSAALIREDPHYPGEWGKRGQRDIDNLAYGCAQERFLDTAGTYPSGRENCFTLQREGAFASCPWIPRCDKFAPIYAACGAAVVVTNHHNFIDGNLKIGLNLDGRPTRGVTVREFALRTCHAVVIDEIDQFQSNLIDKCATHIVLHSRRPWTSAPQQFDTDAKHMPIRVESSLVNSVSHVRLMAEFLLLSICHGALHLTASDDEHTTQQRSGHQNAGWRLAHARDRELIGLLFPGAVAEGESIPPELFGKLDALLPERYGASSLLAGQDNGLDRGWDDVRRALDVLTAPRGHDFLDLVKLELHGLLADTIPDARSRSRAINLLVVRGYLKELDTSLTTLRDHVQQLRHSGLSSANRILEAVHPRAVNSILPLGMLGRAITGYRVTGLDNKEKDAELSAQNISGDPHTYVSELGGLVSLLTARVERPVVGLSATAYFPQAVREHVHAPVAWWMTDAQARSIVAESHKITYGSGHPLMGESIRISGTHPAGKPSALIELGTRLYETKISQKIEKLRRKDPDRARVILAANSYEQCAYLALGLSRAKGFNHRVCVAVPSDDPTRYARYLPSETLARPVTPEQFEDFPAYGDILIAPLSVIARGLNIVVATRSAVQSIYLCTRPPLTIDEPAWMYGSVNAAGMSVLPDGGSGDPAEVLRAAGEQAWQQLGLILRSPTQFSAMTPTLQEQVIAGMLVNLIQLAGRARRGGTDMNLHLVDYAFQDETWSSDLVTIIKRIHSRWPPEVQHRMNDLYGEALGAFLSYAGIDPNQV